MGLITGSWSFTRFQVEDPLPEDHLAYFNDRILQFAFRPLDETSDLERSSGWVDIVDMFDNLFPGRSFLRPPFLSLSWRVDSRSIPSHALKEYCMTWENKIKEEEDLEFLSKDRRQEIRDQTHNPRPEKKLCDLPRRSGCIGLCIKASDGAQGPKW